MSDPKYLRDLAMFTNGNMNLADALRGAADRITELEAEVARLTELLEPEECDGGCPEFTCLRCCSDRLANLEAEILQTKQAYKECMKG
jgi:hypothetical protein